MIEPAAPGAGQNRDPLLILMAHWYGFLGRHRRWLSAFLVVAAVLCAAASTAIHWQTNVLLFFSQNSRQVQSWRQISALPQLADSLHIDLHTKPQFKKQLPSAVRAMAAALRKHPIFGTLWDGVSLPALNRAQRTITADIPALLTRRSFQKLKARTGDPWMQKHFADIHERLEAPGGLLDLSNLTTDPLAIRTLLYRQLQSANAATPLNISHLAMNGGLLMAKNRTHAMIVLSPTFSPQQTRLAAQMLNQLSSVTASIQRRYPHVHFWIIGPYTQYVQNAAQIKRDVAVVSIIGTLLVAAVIWFYFRRIGTLLICMLPPVVGLGTALGLSGLTGAHLPLMILAFSGLILGATTDYGIQILGAYGRSRSPLPGSHTNEAAVAARSLFGPITMSALTSITGYGALAFCTAPGLRAMGLFIAMGTLLIWLVTFLILPAYLSEFCRPRRAIEIQFALPRWVRWVAFIAFSVVTSFLLLQAAKLHYNINPADLNGASPAQTAAQQGFFKVWGNSAHHGVVITRSRSAGKLLKQTQMLQSDLARMKREKLIGGFISPSNLLPDTRRLNRRIARWQHFWTASRIAAIDARLKIAASRQGFRAPSLQSTLFFHRATQFAAPTRLRNSPLSLFPGQVFQIRSHHYLATVVYPNRKLSPRMQTDWTSEIELLFPHVLLVDGSALLFNATQQSKAQTEFLFPWVFLAIFLPVCIYFRRLEIAAAASLSLLVGFIWLAGVAQWIGGGLNFLAMIPLLFTMGVAIDYGVYTASDPALRTDKPSPRILTTGICALTTILGSGAIILAAHPALHWVGLTLVAGICGGYLAALLCVGPFVRWCCHTVNNRCRGCRSWRRVPESALLWLIRIAAAAAALAMLVVCIGQLLMASARPDKAVRLPQHRTVTQTGPNSWKIGHAWMRRVHGVWVMSVGGSSGTLGYDDGALGAPVDTEIENDMLDQLHHFVPSLWAQWVITRGVALDMLRLPHYIPAYIRHEVYAESRSHPDLHAYLSPTYARLLSYEALDDISQNLIDNPLIDAHAVGCTGVAACPAWSGDNCLWLARNFDFEGGPAFNRQKSITFVRPSHGYGFVTVAWPGLSGCVTGFNSEKIGLFINAAATVGFKPIGEPTIIVARQVLQFAHSLSQAVSIFRRAPVFVADSIVVGDGKTGQCIIIEKSPLHCAVIHVDQRAAVANQFTAPVFRNDPVNAARIRQSTSRFRMARALRLINAMRGKVNAINLAKLLRDKASVHGRFIGYGNRNAIDALIATHSVIMNLTNGELWVAAWPYAEGAYIGVKVLPMLSKEPPPLAKVLLPSIPADHFLVSGGWHRFEIARAALHSGYHALAKNHFKLAYHKAMVALQYDPDFFSAYELAGRADLAMGRKKRAAILLTKTLLLDPPYRARRVALRRYLRLAKTP